MYLRLMRATFGTTVSDEHLARARAEEEPFYHGGVTLDQMVEPGNFWSESIEHAEKLFGILNWYELPRYFIPGMEQSEPLDPDDEGPIVQGMVGTEDDTVFVIESFDSSLNCVERTFWGNGSTGSLETEERAMLGHEDRQATIKIRITVGPDGVTLTRDHEEHVLGGDTNAARCSAVMTFITRTRRFEGLTEYNAPEMILNTERELIAESMTEIKALCGDITPPSPEQPGWEQALSKYLSAFGIAKNTIASLLSGKRPDNVGMSFRWETQAIITPDGAFRILLDTTSMSEMQMLTHFPMPPTNEAERAAFYGELYEAMKLAQHAIADLPRIERIAREYNLPIERI